MTTASPLSQIGGLLLFAVLVAALHGGRRLYVRFRTARVHRAAARPVPGRLRRVDDEFLQQTSEWLASLRPPPGGGLPRAVPSGEPVVDRRAS